MHWYDWGYMGGMHALWWLFWLALAVVVVAALVSPQRRARRHQNASPHELLKRRLAAGEITPEEYEQTKSILDRDSAPR